MIQVLNAVEIVAGLVFFALSVIAFAAMDHKTRHCFRVTYGVICIAGLALVAAPFCDTVIVFGVDLARYAEVGILAAFALYLALDRRRIRPQREPLKADPDKTVPMGTLALGLLVLLFFATPRADAAVIAVAQKDGVIVSLTDEPCRLEQVKNLPGRALWAEKGKVHEGCFAVTGGILVAFFDDRTVVLFDLGSFSPASPA